MFEITYVTFITLAILLALTVVAVFFLHYCLWSHDKDSYTTLNEPLKNKDKWWYF